MTYWQRVGVAIGVAAFYAVFISVVLLYPGLKEEPFVQGLTGLITALFVTIELFILVPAPPAIALPVAFVCGAAFYFYLLPQIKPFIFPGKIVKGTIYFKNTNQFVPNVLVRIRGTNQNTKTNEQGDFVLTGVDSDVKTITATYAGVDTDFDIKSSEKYEIEVPKKQINKTQAQKIDASGWSEVKDNLCSQFRRGSNAVQGFVLKKDQISNSEGYQSLILSVQLRGDGEIVHAQAVYPNPESVFRIEEGSQNNFGKWEIPAESNTLRIEFMFCIEREKSAPAITVNDWEAEFWLQKEK